MLKRRKNNILSLLVTDWIIMQIIKNFHKYTISTTEKGILNLYINIKF